MAFRNISRMRLLRVAALCSFPISGYLKSEKAFADANIEDDLPKQVDWVARGAVTPARSQGQCGSCWAHASVSAIESIYQIRRKKLLLLSVQEVIDCAEREVEIDKEIIEVTGKGCMGGWPYEAFRHVMKVGIALEKDYPQRHFLWIILGDGMCRSHSKTIKLATIINDYAYTEPGEAALMRAVARQPIVVTCARTPASLYPKYSGHIIEFEEWPANESEIRHAILVVGYGEDERGKFWKVKESKGERWGENGFAYLRRGGPDKRGVAGIAESPGVYPILH